MQKLINFSFHCFAIIIAVISLLNIPNFAVATKGTGTLWSYTMLVPAVILLFFFSLKRSFDFNNILMLLIITILSYLGLGLINMFIWEDSELTSEGRKVAEDWTYIMRVMLQTMLVMLASYKYAIFAHRQGLFASVINVLILIMVFGALITIFSPFLGFYNKGFFIPGFNNASSLVRPAGFYMNPNSAGYHAVVTLLLVVSLLFRKKVSRILVFVLIVVAFISAFMTLSKAAILMSLIVLFIYFVVGIVYFNRLQTTNKFSLLIIGGLVIGSIVQLVVFLMSQFNQLSAFEQSRLTQIMGLLGGKINTETTTNRSDLARVGFEWIGEAPFLGWGFGAFHYIRHGGDTGIHNMFLMLMGESGIVPALLYASVFIFGIYKSVLIKNMAYRYMSLTFFCITLFFANGNHNLFDNYEIGFLFGLICALGKIDMTERFEQSVEDA